MNKEEIKKDNEHLREILREGQKEYDELQERIDKAIIYINKGILDMEIIGKGTINLNKLLDILKGSDKNGKQ